MIVKIKYEQFPDQIRGKIRGLSIARNDGKDFLVIIDSSRAKISQRRTLGHELAHIFRGHFNSEISLSFAEKDADLHAWEYYRLFRDGLLEGVTV